MEASLATSEKDQRKKQSKRKRKQLYSKADKNALIDVVMHPLAEQHWAFVVVDGVLHALSENNPQESFVKFLKYNLPELVKRILKESG